MDKLQKTLEDWQYSSEEYVDDEEKEKTIAVEVEQLEETITDKGLDGLKQKLHDEAVKWKSIPLNIAVTGSSGAGKSSFVNAFLGLTESDENAAKVGENETTVELKVYFNSDRPNLKLWGMPGVGTPRHPKENYLEEVKFDMYDFFLILSQRRFSEDDKWLAAEIQRRNKRFYFIRTCVDTDISNNLRRTKSKHNPEDVKYTIREEIRKSLVQAEIIDPKIFLVDNFDTSAYEFQDVDRQLLKDCDGLKREALVLSLSNLTVKVLQKKKEVLEKRCQQKAMAIACEYDRRIVQVQLFDEEVNFQAEQLGVDMETVVRNKHVLKISDENIQKCQDMLEKFPLESLKKIPRIHPMFIWIRLIRRMFGISEMTDYSVRVFKFCSLALQQNIDEMYALAIELYDKQAHEAVVNASVYGK